jgi:hypothetical protein
LAGVTIAPTTTQNISVGVNGTTLTATESSTPSSRAWGTSNVAGGPYNTTGYSVSTTATPYELYAGTYYYNCQSNQCVTQYSNDVRVNVSIPAVSGLSASTDALTALLFHGPIRQDFQRWEARIILWYSPRQDQQ